MPDDAPHARSVVGVDLARELEEQVLELRADGPTVAHRAALADLLVAWAESLVALHRTEVTSATPALPLPRVLAAEGRDGELAGAHDGAPAVAGRAWAVRQHPRVRRALAVARAGWSADRWVHDAGPDAVVVLRGHRPGADAPPTGDRSTTGGPSGAGVSSAGRSWSSRRPADLPSEVVVVAGPAGPQDGPRAELVAAGRGDARWDVATALDWLAVHLAPALDPAWELDPVAAFMRSYRAYGGDAEPDRPLAVARTIATAAAWSDALAARAQEPDEDELAWVAGLWARPLALLAPR